MKRKGLPLGLKIPFQRKKTWFLFKKNRAKHMSFQGMVSGWLIVHFVGSCVVRRSSIGLVSALGKLDYAKISSVNVDKLESLNRAQILLWYSACCFTRPPGMQEVSGCYTGQILHIICIARST